MDVSNTSEHIQIEIKMPNPIQEPPPSSKAPNEDLKDMDVLCTFKINVDNQNSEHGWLYANQVKESQTLSATSIDTKAGIRI